MVYRAIGVVSGSSLNGLDIAFVELQESTGRWSSEIVAGERVPYSAEWKEMLKNAASLAAADYHALHIAYGKYLADTINQFITKHDLHYKVQLLSVQGHISFYNAEKKLCAQLGDAATIAALTGINVVSDVRSIDMALNGRGAPVFPVVEKLLFTDQQLFLHIGSNANLAIHTPGAYRSFDVSPANRILDKLAARDQKDFDAAGMMASEGRVDSGLLEVLNELEYYHMPLPKTLSGDFAGDVLLPLFDRLRLSVSDALRTACEHIAIQIASAVKQTPANSMFITGGGANNEFLVSRIKELVRPLGVECIVPHVLTINFKEALAMALIGVLRWREENNVFSYVTGASRDSIGGGVWIGQEA
jgi:anhydro-N-acetylmuramic acid kinase